MRAGFQVLHAAFSLPPFGPGETASMPSMTSSKAPSALNSRAIDQAEHAVYMLILLCIFVVALSALVVR